MFRKNYHFEGYKDSGEVSHFYKMDITKKEAEEYAKYLLVQYYYRFVQYYTMGEINRKER